MVRFNFSRVTLTSYFILLVSVVLMGLSIAEIVLEARIQQVSQSDLQVQYPGSSLAEWLWVPVNPPRLNGGPTTAIIIVGALGILVAVTVLIWVIFGWCGWNQNRVSALTSTIYKI
jgi:hypothetical protein